MALKRIYFLATGHVQGVFFRVHTVEAAKSHNLTGWVRNLDSGHVEGEAQGEEENLQKFLKDVNKGPPASKVEKVQTEDKEVNEGESEFRKIRWNDTI